MEQLHPIERCLQYPPLQGSYGTFSLELLVHGRLCIGDGHSTQVVEVEVLTESPPVEGLSQGQNVVAKLYDPMYINDHDFYINPFLVADKSYTYETAAYNALSDLQGSAIPRYYGSYSLDIVEESTKRSVRLILTELIPGLSLQETGSYVLSQKARQHIMKSFVEFESSLYARDVVHENLHPSNIMLVNPKDKQTHIVFIDFAHVRFERLVYVPEGQEVPECWPGTYISPLLRWHEVRGQTYGFEDWIDWDWQPWLEAEFVDTAATIKPGMVELFMPKTFLRKMQGKGDGGIFTSHE